MPLDVACFNLGFLAAQGIAQLVGPILVQLEPLLIQLNVAGHASSIRDTFLRVGKYSFWAAMLPAVPLMIFGREVITLYVGEQFLPASQVIFLLMLSNIGYLTSMTSRLAAAKDQVKSLGLRIVFVESIHVLIAILFVKYLYLGSLGPALAIILVSAFLHPPIYWAFGLRLAGLSWVAWLRKGAIPSLLPVICYIAFLLTVEMFVPPRTWLSLATSSCFCACLFICICWYTLNNKERGDIVLLASLLKGRFT
jgi:O-antigen/teichoic acid export membrane protein